MTLRRSVVVRLAAAAALAPWALRAGAIIPDPADPKRKPDLGDAAEGSFAGDVISDSKGSSQSGVTLTVTRIGKNLVRVSSDYPRLPVVEIPLTLAMGKILQARGNSVFLLDRSQTPPKLDVSFNNEVSWSGFRR
jgi:hypothetical protein